MRHWLMKTEPGDFAWAAHDGTALALGHYIGGQFRPSKVLNV